MRFDELTGGRWRPWISRQTCRDFALTRSWENSALQFIGHANRVVIGDSRKPRAA
jgi:hypothetical protein